MVSAVQVSYIIMIFSQLRKLCSIINHNVYLCSDINECQLDSDGCEHNCTNTMGSFVCSCLAGYTIGDNSRQCIGEA